MSKTRCTKIRVDINNHVLSARRAVFKLPFWHQHKKEAIEANGWQVYVFRVYDSLFRHINTKGYYVLVFITASKLQNIAYMCNNNL